MTFFRSPLSIFVFSFLCMTIVIFGQGTANMCDWIQCANGGICQSAEGSTLGYKCRCQFGFTGTLCESRLNITTCVRNPCLHNGNCTVTNDYQVKCTCPKGYTGARCEISI